MLKSMGGASIAPFVISGIAPLNFNRDTQHDAIFEAGDTFKAHHFWYLCFLFRECILYFQTFFTLTIAEDYPGYRR